jgi:hypothetical protein
MSLGREVFSSVEDLDARSEGSSSLLFLQILFQQAPVQMVEVALEELAHHCCFSSFGADVFSSNQLTFHFLFLPSSPQEESQQQKDE